MNKIIDVYDISYEGAGVGKVDGQVVFVPKTLKGETVEVEILKSTKTYALAKVVKILKASGKRIEPKCQYFDKCGGCDFQHCDYENEKQLKKEILQRELKKVGFEDEIEFAESDKRFGYRNKIKFEVSYNKLGYFKPKSHNFFEVKHCEIADEKINKTLPEIEQFIYENNFKNLKNIYIKSVDEKLAVCFLFPKNEEKVLKNIKKIEILSDFCVFFAFGEVLESNNCKVYSVLSEGKLTKKMFETTFETDVSAFEQVNDVVAEKLYLEVLKYSKNKRVINAYSGQGLLTYLISKEAKFVYGIEYQKSAHEKAEKLKLKQEDYKIENICAKVEDSLECILLRDKIDLIVLDPAREGCDKKVLEKIVGSNIEEVVYVSCNFATLTRDLFLLKQIYDIKSVKIFDMFPCTANLETFVVLKKRA